MTEPSPIEPWILDAMRAVEERDRLAADAAGMTLEDYQAEQDRRLREEERERDQVELRRQRVERLRPLESRLAEPVYRALVEGRKLKATPALRDVYDWLTSTPAAPFCVLTGIQGTGKTTACAYALARVPDSEYLHAHHLSTRVRPWPSELAAGTKKCRMNAQLLVLDDLGTESTSDRTLEAIYAVVDERLGMVRSQGQRVPARTIITTNLSRKKLLEHVDARVAGRLIQNARWAEAGIHDLRRAS